MSRGMIRRISRRAVTSTGRRVAIALAAVVVVLGSSAAVYAATTPDFSVSVTPASQSVPAGYAVSYTVKLSPSNGFTGTVTLTAGNLPKSSSQTQVTTATWTVNGTQLPAGQAAQVSVPAGSLGMQATLTISGGQPATGTYSPTVTATSGSLTHTQSMSLTVVSQNSAYFGLSPSPSSHTIVQGGSTSSTINISRTNWTGAVSLSATSLPSGATATFSPASTTGATSSLSITTTSSVAPGIYPITVTGTGATSNKGSTTNSTAFTLIVQAANTLSATAAGVAAPNTAVTPSATLAAATSAATGTVTFSVFGPSATAPTTCTGTGWTTAGSASVNGPSTYRPSSGYTLTSSGGTYWWYASYGGDAYNTASHSTCGAGMAATVVQDFSIGTSGATSQTALTGGTSDDSAPYTNTVTPIGGYPGTVALTVTGGLPTGANASFTPNPTSSGSTLTVDVGTNVQPGTYNLTVQGQATIAGTVVTHTTPLTLIVQGSKAFTISGTVPSPLYPGASGQTFPVTITNPNSFSIHVTNDSLTVQAVNAPNCLSSWFSITLPSVPSGGLAVAANASTTVQAAAKMLDVNAPQDACKGKTLTLTYTGTYGK